MIIIMSTNIYPTMLVPSEFRCKINNIILTRPATCSDGSTYEYELLKDWLDFFDVSPTRGTLLPTKEIVEDHVLKQKIEEWREKNCVPIADNIFAKPSTLRRRILAVLKDAPIHLSTIIYYARKFQGWHGNDSKCDDSCGHNRGHTAGYICQHGYSRPRCSCGYYLRMECRDLGLIQLPDIEGKEEVINDLENVIPIVPRGRQYLGNVGLKPSPERYLQQIKDMRWFDENEEIDLEFVRIRRLFTIHPEIYGKNLFWPQPYEPTEEDTVPVFNGTYTVGSGIFGFDIPDLVYNDPVFDALHPMIKCMFKRWAFSRILGGCFFKKVTLDLGFLGSAGLLRKDSPEYIRLIKSLRYQCPETCKQCQITNISRCRNSEEDYKGSSYTKKRKLL